MLMLVPADVLFLFIPASIALALAPGPDNLFVLSQSALYGSRSGLLVPPGWKMGPMQALTGANSIFAVSQ